MRKVALIASALGALFLSTAAQADTILRFAHGCVLISDLETFYRIANKDTDLGRRFMYSKQGGHYPQCGEFDVGQRVFVERRTRDRQYSCVRRPNGDYCMWIYSAAVKEL